MASSSLLLLISAPSGGGKTTLCENLLRVQEGLVRAITCTTRPPRAGEVDGRDYYFLSQEAFQQRVQAGEFLEHATVYERRYGVLLSEVLDKLRAGRDVLLNVDVQGAATIRDRAATDRDLRRALVTVFLAPPSLAELETRLRGRAQDEESVMRKRLDAARLEIEQSRHFDYVLVSGTREEDLGRVRAILQAEKLRQGRVSLPTYG